MTQLSGAQRTGPMAILLMAIALLLTNAWLMVLRGRMEGHALIVLAAALFGFVLLRGLRARRRGYSTTQEET